MRCGRRASRTPAFEADELLRLVTGRGHLQQEAAAPLKDEQAQRFQTLLRRRCERYPLQYLARALAFYGLELAVGEGSSSRAPTPRRWWSGC